MSHTFRIRLTIGVIVVLLVVTPFLIPVNQFRPTIEQNVSAALGRRVHVGRLRLSLLSGSLSAETLPVGDDPTFSTRNNLHFGMVATVASAPSGGIGAAVGTAGALNEVLGILTGGNARSQIKGLRIPFLVQGPTSNPQFVPDVSRLVMQTLEEQFGTKP